MNWCKSHFDILALIGSLIIASITRIALPFQLVFQKGTVVFNSVDAYYQLRYADLIAAHYPQTAFFDSYTNIEMGHTPFFNLLLVWLNKPFGNLEMVAAYLPAILGVLTLIPIFIIASRTFNNKWVTSLAVLFTAVLPGQFLNRTQLGAADYHCLEIFLTTTMMMFVVLALTVKNKWYKGAFGLLTIGTFLIYSYAWAGSLAFAAMMAVFLYAWFGIWWAKKNPVIWQYAIVNSLILAVAMVCIHFAKLQHGIGMFLWPLYTTVSEEAPLLISISSAGSFIDLRTVWGYFGFCFYLSLVGLGMLAYRIIKYRKSPEILLAVWFVIIFALTLAMRRWAYYFAVNVAVLSAYSCFVIGKGLIVKAGVVKIRNFALCVVVLFGFVLVPLMRSSVGVVRNPANYMSGSWQEATQWLRNELSPTQDAEYYKVHPKEQSPVDVPIVLSWWDYGYWIVRQSHMVTMGHPGTELGRYASGRLLLNNDVEETMHQIREMNVKYVVVDNLMVVEKFYAIVEYSKFDLRDYYEYDGLELQRTPKYWKTFLSQLYYFDGQGIEGLELVFPVERSGFIMGYDYYEKWAVPEGVKIFEVVE